jgi:glycosyltransferase involved in cell wall biosynthesis
VTARSVLFVHASDEAYGADRILLAQMTGLIERGWVVGLVLPDDSPPGWLTASAGALNISVERRWLAVARRRYLRPAGIPGYVLALLRARRRLRALIERERPTFVHVNTSALLVAAVLGRPAGVRVVWHIHEIVVRPRLMAALFRSLPPLTADRVVAVSDAVRRHLFAPWRRAPVAVVRNGIGSRVPCPMPGLRARGGPVVAFVGRLNRWKGYELFVAAVETIAGAHPDATFVIAGDAPSGEERRMAELRARVDRSAIREQILLLGFVADGASVFDAADIAVVPSLWPEPFGLVTVEAMRAGWAGVAADDGASRVIID